MLRYLKSVTTYVVFPPPLIFSGKLKDGIIFFLDTMLHATIDFEGVFIIDETTSLGYKWKTGFHEEQPKISKVEDLDFKTDEGRSLYNHLVEVFNTRPVKEERIARSTEKKKKEEILNENQLLLRTITNEAISKEISKMTSFEHIPHKERNIISNNLTLLVIAEIRKHFTDSSTELPWTEEILTHDVQRLVNTYVMKTKFIKQT